MEKLESEVNVTFWFSGQSDILVLADVPPPLMEKLESEVNVTFWFSGQSDILVLVDVCPPPPGMEKLKFQVNVTFWFSGQSDILVLADVSPPPEIEIGLNMNAIEKNHCKRGHQVPTFQYHYLILCLNRKLVNFNFKWIWIYGLEPLPPPLSSEKNEMVIFGLRSTSDDWPGWSMDSNPIRHLSLAKKN